MFYKLICSDLDDTLITLDGRLTDGVIEAVARYRAAGGKFCVVTGRMTVGAIPVCKKLGLTDEVITYQGAITGNVTTGEILDSIPVSNADAVAVSEYLEKLGVYFQTYSGDYFLTQKGTDYSKLYSNICGAEYKETGSPLSRYIRETGLTPPKLLIIEDVTKVPALEKDLVEKFGSILRINTSKPYIIEIVPKAVSKAVAVAKLAEKYGIKREEIICIGDSSNDVPMISYAGLGVVVGNGTEFAKQSADLIAPDCDHEAVKWVIDTYGFRDAPAE